MWWGLLVGVVALAGFTIEMVEGRWLSRRARNDLRVMRTHAHAGHRWDALRGEWQA